MERTTYELVDNIICLLEPGPVRRLSVPIKRKRTMLDRRTPTRYHVRVTAIVISQTVQAISHGSATTCKIIRQQYLQLAAAYSTSTHV